MDALAALRTAVPGTHIIVLSSEAPNALVHAALAGGARGYIPKTVSTELFLQAVRLVFAGGVYVPATVLDPPALQANEATLTRRQQDVLVQLAAGAPTNEIASTLGIAEATVRVHIATLIRTLRVDSREALVKTPLAAQLRAQRGSA
jgi:DNA-binding NarL/FixJ family response regulator